MTTTSLATSRKIFELTGWTGPDKAWQAYTIKDPDDTLRDRWSLRSPKPNKPTSKQSIPAYDLAYLLERLPDNTEIFKYPTKFYEATYYSNPGDIEATADNPAEAAGLLVIKLAEAGLLKGET
jgi:hypothetical protein